MSLASKSLGFYILLLVLACFLPSFLQLLYSKHLVVQISLQYHPRLELECDLCSVNVSKILVPRPCLNHNDCPNVAAFDKAYNFTHAYGNVSTQLGHVYNDTLIIGYGHVISESAKMNVLCCQETSTTNTKQPIIMVHPLDPYQWLLLHRALPVATTILLALVVSIIGTIYASRV